MPKHYPWGPSSSSRWLRCPGSLGLIASLPTLPSAGAAAIEGTLAHAVCEAKLHGQPVPEGATEEMIECADRYVKFIDEHVRVGADIFEFIEETIAHKTIPDFGGTIDYAALLDGHDERRLWIVDYKYGKQVEVHAEENTQALCYALLADDAWGPFDSYTVTIFQPRTGGTDDDTWTFDRERLMQFREQLLLAQSRPNWFEAGGHCRYCPAAPHCDVLFEAAQAAAEEEFQHVDHERWEALMDLAPALKRLLEDVPNLMLDAMKRGTVFKRYKAVQGVGHRKWIADEEQIIATLRERGLRLSDCTDVKLKSPAQLEKAGYIAAAHDLVVKPNTGPKIVPVTDKRPAMELGVAEQEFVDFSHVLE